MWTQQELKERLIQEIICYLDKGKVSMKCTAHELSDGLFFILDNASVCHGS